MMLHGMLLYGDGVAISGDLGVGRSIDYSFLVRYTSCFSGSIATLLVVGSIFSSTSIRLAVNL